MKSTKKTTPRKKAPKNPEEILKEMQEEIVIPFESSNKQVLYTDIDYLNERINSLEKVHERKLNWLYKTAQLGYIFDWVAVLIALGALMYAVLSTHL